MRTSHRGRFEFSFCMFFVFAVIRRWCVNGVESNKRWKMKTRSESRTSTLPDETCIWAQIEWNVEHKTHWRNYGESRTLKWNWCLWNQITKIVSCFMSSSSYFLTSIAQRFALNFVTGDWHLSITFHVCRFFFRDAVMQFSVNNLAMQLFHEITNHRTFINLVCDGRILLLSTAFVPSFRFRFYRSNMEKNKLCSFGVWDNHSRTIY